MRRRTVLAVTAGQSNNADVPDILTLTSVIDNRAHKVTGSELCASHSTRTGRFAALCGHLVSPAPLVEAEGTPCTRCVQLDPTPTAVPAHRRRRGWALRRLLAV